jgi:fibronectin type 3 domain-containing protein
MKVHSIRWPRISFPAFRFLAAILFFVNCASLFGQIVKAKPDKGHAITISWSRSKSQVKGYYVYRESPPGGPRKRLTREPIPEIVYRDSSVLGGETYEYYVTAIDAKGRESKPSNHVTAKVPSP